MYSTKRTNRLLVDNNAYNCIGDQYKDPKQNPFRQGVPGEKLKPFEMTAYPKNEDNGNFTKLKYHPDEYRDGNKYITTQPLDKRKNGFGTKDAHKRDEFSNYIRTEQYREAINKEKVFTDKAALAMGDKLKETQESAAQEYEQFISTQASANMTPRKVKTERSIDYNSAVMQYDIGRQRLNEFNPKSSKDTFYKFDQEHAKRMTTKPASYDIGACAWSQKYEPPGKDSGGKSGLKNFYDKSHLNVGVH